MESLFLKSVIAEFRSSGLEEATFGDVSGNLSSFSWILVTNFSTLALKFTFELNVINNLTGLLVEKLSQFCQLCYFRLFSHAAVFSPRLRTRAPAVKRKRYGKGQSTEVCKPARTTVNVVDKTPSYVKPGFQFYTFLPMKIEWYNLRTDLPRT